MSLSLVVVTATTNPSRALPCVASWGSVQIVSVINGMGADLHPVEDRSVGVTLGTKDYLGSVPAFRKGVDFALDHSRADIICCLHDDLELHDPAWAQKVIRHFERVPSCGLLGFGGAIGLGDSDIYQKPYAPEQLARIGFRSNLVDAETHGMRSLLTERVACLDGFSLIGRRDFWMGRTTNAKESSGRPWTYLEDLGLVHHIYDGAVSLLAARHGWDTWYLPIRCRHLGGQTAVGDQGYTQWAERTGGGDHAFWTSGHEKVYAAFHAELPLRI